MGVSRSGTFYLERQKILLAKRPRPIHMFKTLRSHRRPVNHLPELKQPDTPQQRVITQKETRRVPYEPPKSL